MNRRLKSTEILFIIILICCAYFFLFYKPVTERIDALEQEKVTYEEQIAMMTPFVSQKKKWEKELDEIFVAADGNPVSIAYYDNIENVIDEMHAIFDPCPSFQMTIDNPSMDDHITARTIRIVFRANSYSDAVMRLEMLQNSPYKYVIGNVSVSGNLSGISAGVVSVSVVITSYEFSESGEL